MHKQAKTGSIKVGKAADLVLLTRELSARNAEAIHDQELLMPLFGGEAVFERAVL